MKPLILLTGATGYVGGRLLKKLESEGCQVRCLARHPEFLQSKVGASTQVMRGDLLDLRSLELAMTKMDIAYYLVHSMGSAGSFEAEELLSAENFARAAKKSGLKKIIYLGGLSHGSDLSAHLKSRQRVGQILAQSGIPVIEFQASIIIGSGSLSFEMIRALMERLPAMTTPKWVNVLAQPIAIEDVISYLSQAATLPMSESQIFEIGGPDKMSYLDLMKEYGRQRNLKRWIIPVPVLSPGLSSLWLGLITPLYARVGRKLVESIRHETTVHDDRALKIFNIKPLPIREAIRKALASEDQQYSATRWSDALSSSRSKLVLGEHVAGPRFVESLSVRIEAPVEKVFLAVTSIGGKNGWYGANWIWKIRGYFDLVVGGVGLRRGRKDTQQLLPGDTLDWWRVEAVEPNRLLRLVAEMKVPGRAWLQFEMKSDEGKTLLVQTALFDAHGLLGRLYWFLLYPIHRIVFMRLLDGIRKAVFFSSKESATIRRMHSSHKLTPINSVQDIPKALLGTPAGLLLEYHNLGREFDSYTQAQLLIGMCMDSRKHLHIPDNFAYIVRAAGANLRYSEFKVSYAIGVGGVQQVALIGHTECGMENLASRKEQFVKGLVDRAGWDAKLAEDHFLNFCMMFEIGEVTQFILSEALRINARYPKIPVVPMLYKVEDNRIYLIDAPA